MTTDLELLSLIRRLNNDYLSLLYLGRVPTLVTLH